MCDVFRKLDAAEIVELLKAGSKQAVRQEEPGLRLLLGFIEVKRPGIEVLTQLQSFSSLERVSLQLIAGTWVEPEDAQEAASVFQILEVLEEATRVGALDLDLGRETLPRQPRAVRALLRHLRLWFGALGARLDAGERVPDASLNFITQLALLELNLLERRVSKIASSIDPYDARGIGRLMPVMSFYDQDIEHMKGVVSRLASYKPFNERLLTMEHALSANEMEKVIKALARDPLGAPLARITRAMRATPMLDREYAYLLAALHQTATLRHLEQGTEEHAPDLLTTLLQVAESPQRDGTIAMRMEPEMAEALWPTVGTWGFEMPAPGVFTTAVRETAPPTSDRRGMPRLPQRPKSRGGNQLSLKDLVQLQMNNDAFICGLLDNARVSNLPGLVAMIVLETRNLRVDKIISVRRLHTARPTRTCRACSPEPGAGAAPAASGVHPRAPTCARVDLERLARPRSECGGGAEGSGDLPADAEAGLAAHDAPAGELRPAG
jgi:hypothetical protein